MPAVNPGQYTSNVNTHLFRDIDLFCNSYYSRTGCIELDLGELQTVPFAAYDLIAPWIILQQQRQRQ